MKKRMLVGLDGAFRPVRGGHGPGHQAAPRSPDRQDMVVKAKSSVQKVSAAEVKGMIDKKDKVIYSMCAMPASLLPVIFGAMNISRAP
jgi:hypothetical protein